MEESIIEGKDEIINYFGEAIFPLKTRVVLGKFGESLVKLIEEGYFIRSQMQIGINVTMLKKIKGYIELSNKGWEYYHSETIKTNKHQ